MDTSRKTGRAWIEVDIDALRHNVAALKRAIPPGCSLMAVVKAGAYGHGIFEVSTHLDRMGISAFAVATIDEGIRLRRYGIRGEILILGYTDISRASELKEYDLMQTLIDQAYAEALNDQGIPVHAHIKIDTGMHRLGIPSGEPSQAERIFHMKNISICGLFTHLCCPDSRLPEDVAFTRGQICRFYGLVDALKKRGVMIPRLHIQSSYGLLNYPDLVCDYVRVGIALYGVLSSPGEDTVLRLDLRPVLSLKSRVVLIRPVDMGESVGYGRSFTAGRASRIAVVPVGYGDGYPRDLSDGNGRVWIGGQSLPVAGRVCMDQLAVDITDAEGVAVGDVVTLIGEGKAGLSAADIARRAGSISNELLCRMGTRLPVVVKCRS